MNDITIHLWLCLVLYLWLYQLHLLHLPVLALYLDGLSERSLQHLLTPTRSRDHDLTPSPAQLDYLD